MWRRADYQALFAAAPEGAQRGESTSLYLYDHQAQRRIIEALPHAKMIALLRDPIDRSHSNWTHLWSAGLEPEGDFLRACDLEDTRAAQGWAPFWRYLDLGRYGHQLRHLYSVVPREQILLLRYRALREQPAGTLDTIFEFLGLETGLVQHVPAENVTTHATNSPRNRAISAALHGGARLSHGRLGPAWKPAEDWLTRHLQREQNLRVPLQPEARAALIPRITDDVKLLEDITGDDFGDWLDIHHAKVRRPLTTDGKIGTAHQSIDHPLGDRDSERDPE